MMLSKVEAGKKIGDGSNNKKLLNEIDAISKAFYLENKATGSSSTSNTRSRSKFTGKVPLSDAKAKFKSNTNEDLPHKDKKSIWKNWKPLKAFSSVKNRRFKCCFSLQAHFIEGLPPRFNDVSFVVHWKRRDGGLVTRPAKVCDGTVEFDEKLTHTCLVYGSRNGPHHSANYEAKHFLLYASVFEAPELDLGKHRVDLTRLLPLTLEELEEEKSSGKWTTSFKLSGKARGATMNVSFGYTVIGDNCPSGNNLSVHPVLNMKQNNLTLLKPAAKFGPSDGKDTMQPVGNLHSKFNQRSHASSQSVEDIKDLHEVLPISKSEPASSVSMLYQKFDEEKLDSSKLDVFIEHVEPIKPDSYLISNSERVDVENERGDSVIEQGIELPLEEQEKPEEGAATAAADFSVEIAEVDSSVSMLYQKSDEEKLDSSKLDVVIEHVEPIKPDFYLISNSGRVDFENEREDNEFSVIEQGIELALEEKEIPEEDATTAAADFSVESAEVDASALVAFEEGNELPRDGDSGSEQMERDCGSKVDDICSKDSLMEELESALISVSNLETEALGSPDGQENYMGVKMDHTPNRLGRSHRLDDVTETVASEFLNMLGIEHSPFGLSSESEPESPRERLLRQFEKDTVTGGFSLFDFGLGDEDQAECGYNEPTAPEWGDFSKDFEFSSAIQAAEEHRMETQSVKSKMRATMLEDLETEALMHELGLDEKAFLCSPHKSSTGFGSPIDMPLEEPLELPPLGEGLGPFLQTKNGGFLRSMNPSLFSKAKSSGNLIMQASNPVVVPAEMGSGIMEILQVLASVGIEKLSMQANKLMPLEDITGKTMQQVAWEAAPTLEGTESQYVLQHESEVGQDLSSGKRVKRSSGARSSEFSSLSVGNQVGSEYVSLEDLAPLAMDKIEALSMEGLRIQSGMSDEDAPSNISTQSIGEISAFQGMGADITGALGLEGTAGLQLLDIKDTGDEIDGLMGLSLTLDEWMRLDSGDIYDEDQISQRTSKILAAHHATSLDLIRGGSKGERRRGKGAGRKCGLLGNNFTVALMVQLRDPLRNYEPVGAPMLSLIQVERVFVPPKPKIYRVVSEVRNNNEEDDESESVVKEVQEKVKEEKISEEEGIPEYRVTEVHVAGLKTEPGKKKLWGTKTQQQSGSRWLLANGMGKSNKNTIMKSKTVSKSTAAPVTTVQSDTLWSISSHINGTGAKRKELVALNPLKRNPNVILPNETIRLK